MFDSVVQFFEGIEQNFQIIISNQGILEDKLIDLYEQTTLISIAAIASLVLMIIFFIAITSKQNRILKETGAIADELYEIKEYFKNQEVQQLRRQLAAKEVIYNGNIDQ